MEFEDVPETLLHDVIIELLKLRLNTGFITKTFSLRNPPSWRAGVATQKMQGSELIPM